MNTAILTMCYVADYWLFMAYAGYEMAAPFTTLHKLGYSVTPLIYGDKIPAEAWKHRQTKRVSLEQCEAWDRKRLNVGIVTGRISNLVVLDIDGAAGYATLEAWERINGALPATVTVKTSKGEHRYFAYPKGRTVTNLAGVTVHGEVMSGIDFRADGGYVVAPNSLHPSGHVYRFIHAPDDTPLADIPDWLLDMVAQPERAARAAPDYMHKHCEGNGSRYGLTALQRECEAVATAPSGRQDVTLNSAAFTIGQLVAGGELQASYALSSLINAGLAMIPSGRPWMMQEVSDKVRRAMTDGARTPRTAPRATAQQSHIHIKQNPHAHSQYAGA